MSIRAAFYVDGFNVYHALHNLKQPHLKWLNWRALAEQIIPSRSETLVRTVICTAVKRDDPGKQIRHRCYVTALETVGVECLQGHFATEERACRNCDTQWDAPVEKQSDVNLGLSVLDDAYQDVFDHCYLVTADGDQCATVRMLKHRFPEKRVTTVVLTGQSHNFKILSLADAKLTITEGALERCLFPRFVAGQRAVARPLEYDPPPGWVPPELRP